MLYFKQSRVLNINQVFFKERFPLETIYIVAILVIYNKALNDRNILEE